MEYQVLATYAEKAIPRGMVSAWKAYVHPLLRPNIVGHVGVKMESISAESFSTEKQRRMGLPPKLVLKAIQR